MKVEKIGEWKVKDGWIFSKRVYLENDNIQSWAWKKEKNWWTFISHYEDVGIKVGAIVIYTPQGRAINYRVQGLSFNRLKIMATKLTKKLREGNDADIRGGCR